MENTVPSSGPIEKKSARPVSSETKKKPAVLEQEFIQQAEVRPCRISELVQMSSEAAKRCAPYSDENAASQAQEEGRSSPSQLSVWRVTASQLPGTLSATKTVKAKSQPARTSLRPRPH